MKNAVAGLALFLVAGGMADFAAEAATVVAQEVPVATSSGTSEGTASEPPIDPAKRARLEAKARRAAEHGPAGFPDQAQTFYVNSRTGPIITRGPGVDGTVRTLSPQMYLDGMRQIRRMPRYDSARRVVGPSDEARSQVSADPFDVPVRDSLGSWTSIGPANQGGRTRALLIDPVDPDRMYAAGVAGGIWRSTDAGANWTTNTDQLENLAVVSLAFDPADSSVIYAGTGEGFGNLDALRGVGVFRSTDAGGTWTRLASTDSSDFHYAMAIQVSPRDARRIWVATRTGLFRSTDSGASFAAVAGITAGGGCTDMAMQRQGASGFVFVSCGTFSNQGRVYRVADDDLSSAEPVLAEPGQSRSSIAIAPSDEQVVYVMASRGTPSPGAGLDGLRGVYRSTTGGAPGSFTLRRDGSVAPVTVDDRIQISLLSNPVLAVLAQCGLGSSVVLNQGWYDNVLAVDPVDPDIVWAGGIDLWRSDDGGSNWGVASYWWFTSGFNSQYAHADQHAIVFHPQYDGIANRTLYVGNDGGVQRTTDARAAVGSTLAAVCGTPVPGAVTWEDRNNGYVTTQFYDGVAYPDGLAWFGGLQDNGNLRGTAASTDWSVLEGGDGGYVALDTLNDATPTNDVLFIENTGNSMRRSVNGGFSFFSVAPPVSSSGFLFIAPFAMAQTNRQQLWAGGFDIWRTIDRASSWTRMTSQGGTCGNGSISAVAVHPANGNRVLVGMSDGCFHVRTDALGAPTAGQWPGGTIAANRFISWVAWDPTDLGTAYATVSAFGVDNVYKTTNAGLTWTPSVGSGVGALPQIPMLSVAVNPNNGSQVFVGSDLGVFTSIDGGATWMVENTGFSRTPVESLKFDQSGARLFAFTHGRGAWRTELCDPCRSVGGTVSGLTGNSVGLRLNGGPELLVASNGAFVFPDAIATGDAYAVSVSTQPSAPVLSCTVIDGSGTVPAGDVTDVQVACAAPTFTISGTLSGLAAGNDVVLRNNGGDELTVVADGAFTFPTPVADGGTYAVTVLTQPTTPNQTCVVANGSGTVAGTDVTDVSVVCTTTTYRIGGTLSGLAPGNDVVLRNNGGNDFTATANGAFTFTLPVADGDPYAVTVLTQPTTPNQTCVVTNGSGTVGGSDVNSVSVVCTTNTYLVGGTLSGLVAGSSVVLRNNGGDNLTVTADGAFVFATPVDDGAPYAVTVAAQPTSPPQFCAVTAGTGSVAGANVANVAVNCFNDDLFRNGFETATR